MACKHARTIDNIARASTQPESKECRCARAGPTARSPACRRASARCAVQPGPWMRARGIRGRSKFVIEDCRSLLIAETVMSSCIWRRGATWRLTWQILFAARAYIEALRAVAACCPRRHTERGLHGAGGGRCGACAPALATCASRERRACSAAAAPPPPLGGVCHPPQFLVRGGC